MRAPTRDQTGKEHAVLFTAVADLAVVTLMFAFAASTHSLTLLSEAVRVALMLVIEFYSLFLLRAVHRDRLGRFGFGIGKVEQVCFLAIGAALLFSGFWIMNRLVDLVLFNAQAALPLGLAIAAAVNAINTLINLLGWYAMFEASRNDDSPIFRAQLRSRVVKLVSSLFVQATLTIAALAMDPVVSTWLDGLGAAFVAVTMMTIGVQMCLECAPDLLDRPVPEVIRKRVDEAVAAAGLRPQEVTRLRTRRSGSTPHIEMTLAPLQCASRADFERKVRLVEQAIACRIDGGRIAVVVDTGLGRNVGLPAAGPIPEGTTDWRWDTT
jgi:divalent metal cation (Fe/Co/Zn/Cd) transporter